MKLSFPSIFLTLFFIKLNISVLDRSEVITFP
jgi:hypothetical protein